MSCKCSYIFLPKLSKCAVNVVTVLVTVSCLWTDMIASLEFKLYRGCGCVAGVLFQGGLYMSNERKEGKVLKLQG